MKVMPIASKLSSELRGSVHFSYSQRGEGLKLSQKATGGKLTIVKKFELNSTQFSRHYPYVEIMSYRLMEDNY